MQKLKILDLFSGIGGFSLGLERTGGFGTVAFCEIEEFPRQVLAKHWPNIPIHRDVRKLSGADVGPVDVICGGYPCQPFSTAGKRRGAEDDRHLWPEFSRLVDELRPAWVIGENVAGHISMGLDDVLSDLEGQGYAVRTFVIPACAVDAPHRRDRCWTVANAKGNCGRPGLRKTGSISDRHKPANGGRAMANANIARPQGRTGTGNPSGQRTGGNEHPERCTDMPRATWPAEPGVGRVAHGVPKRVDRLKALGNAVVPQVVEMIGYAILDAEQRFTANKTERQ